MSDLKILAQVIQNMASGMTPPVNMLLEAAKSVRETEQRLQALEAIAGAAAKKLGLDLEQIGLGAVAGDDKDNKEIAQRRQAADRILRGGR